MTTDSAARDGLLDILFYGVASPYTFESIESAKRAGLNIVGFVHNRPSLQVSAALTPLLLTNDLAGIDRRTPVLIPLLTPGHRKTVAEEVVGLGFTHWAELVDPTSILASSTSRGAGFQVNAGVVIGANSVFGRHVLVNRSVSIGHDVTADDYVTFGPACVICGTCSIGRGTFIGANATVLPRISIGSNCIVGAGAVVARDVPDRSMVAGNPAKIIKTDIHGYNDVCV